MPPLRACDFLDYWVYERYVDVSPVCTSSTMETSEVGL